MVSFSLLRGRSGKDVTPADEADAASEHSADSSGLADLSLGPSTPDGVAAAAAPGKRYWPTAEEVEEVLQRLSPEDRADCDAAMANRWAPASRGEDARAARVVCTLPGRCWPHMLRVVKSGRPAPQPLIPPRRLLPATSCAHLCPPAAACRYLRATGGDQKHAARRIADTLAWRRAEQPEHMVCTACRANHKSHYMQVRARCAARFGAQRRGLGARRPGGVLVAAGCQGRAWGLRGRPSLTLLLPRLHAPLLSHAHQSGGGPRPHRPPAHLQLPGAGHQPRRGGQPAVSGVP